jgi:hypothetical protein
VGRLLHVVPKRSDQGSPAVLGSLQRYPYQDLDAGCSSSGEARSMTRNRARKTKGRCCMCARTTVQQSRMLLSSADTNRQNPYGSMYDMAVIFFGQH